MTKTELEKRIATLEAQVAMLSAQVAAGRQAPTTPWPATYPRVTCNISPLSAGELEQLVADVLDDAAQMTTMRERAVG